MTETDDDQKAPATEAKAPPAGNPLRGAAIVVAIIIALFFALSVFMERRTPISSQAIVQAYVIGIAPEVSGKVASIQVADNSRVKQGDVLFTLDPQQFKIAVEEAESRLARVGQTIGVSVASVDLAQARLVEANASLDLARVQYNRSSQLIKTGAVSAQRLDADKSRVDQLVATVAASEADLRRAQEELGPAGNDNPQIREALAALARAQLDLLRTTVRAPSDGYVTNLQLAVGSFASAGQQAITFIDSDQVWISAAFKENSLENVKVGDKAEVLFDALPGQLFPATVESMGLGVAQGSIDPKTGLPKISETSGWIRTPQSFPIRIVLDGEKPKGVFYGAQAHVVVYTGQHPLTSAIGKLLIVAISYLTFLN